MTAGDSLRLRGSALDGWLCAAHCGPLLASGDGGATIATASGVFRECDYNILKHIEADTSAVEESEIMSCITCDRV